MNQELSGQDFDQLARLVNQDFLGDLSQITRAINQAIYIMHYVEPDDFTPNEKQDVCYVLHQVKECLQQTEHQLTLRKDS